MLDLLKKCRLCPRNCGVDRSKGQHGFCGAGASVRVGRAALHMWEEPCISGENGSGTVFFSYCTLQCVYCQNTQISQGHAGKEITIDRLAEIFLELQSQGANNINLVTPTHYLPQILTAIDIAKKNGLNLPIVYNTSGYEKGEMIQMLDGLTYICLILNIIRLMLQNGIPMRLITSKLPSKHWKRWYGRSGNRNLMTAGSCRKV